MDDLVRTKQDADVRDPAFIIVEKGKVAGPGLFQETYRFALSRLQSGVAKQRNAQEPENRLGKTAAVDAENAFAAPQIRRIQKTPRQLPDGRGIAGCAQRVPYLPRIPDLIRPPAGNARRQACELAAHRDLHRDPVVFDGRYPVRRQSLSFGGRIAGCYQVRGLAPAFVAIEPSPHPAPVPAGLLQYPGVLAKNKLANHLGSMGRICPERADGDATNCRTHSEN